MSNIDLTHTEKVLNDYVDYVVRESKKNAPKAFGYLKKSIKKGNVIENPNSISVYIESEDYLPYIDKGVSGVKKKYNTPFKYTNKKPPVNKLQTWVKRKSNKFLGRDRKQQAFAVQNAIFNNGIKPTKFFTTPSENAFKELPQDVVEAYGLDLEDFINFTLKE